MITWVRGSDKATLITLHYLIRLDISNFLLRYIFHSFFRSQRIKSTMNDLDANVGLILQIVYSLAKYSGFVFMPLVKDSSYSVRFKYFSLFMASLCLGLLTVFYVDIYLPSKRMIPSKIIELGANFLIKTTLVIPLMIKVCNYINRDSFVKYVVLMKFCCKLVS